MSARDVGGASGIAEMAHAIKRDARFESRIVADEPAASVLAKKGVSFERVLFGAAKNLQDAQQMLSGVRDILEKWPCDAVLASLSGPNAGLDEALLRVAPPRPTFALQDYWGDVNIQLESPANTYFVVDAVAAELTRNRCATRAIAVGSVKHSRTGQTDTVRLRARFRNRICPGGDRPIAIFFGQPLWQVAGYRETIARFSAALKRAAPAAICLYRPHPAEDESAIKTGMGELNRIQLLRDGSTEEALCGADLVVSVFSSCGMDQIMLARGAAEPLGVPVYLRFEPEVFRWTAERTGIDYVPAASAGYALEVTDEADLERTISEALAPGCKENLWRKACREIPEPAAAPLRVLDTIAGALAANAAKGISVGS